LDLKLALTMIKALVDQLSVKLKNELPGERAHVEMAPIKRPLPDEARNWPDTKLSGVLILFYPYRNRIFTTLMMRPDYNGVHSKQVSFPGGRKEEEDEDIQFTALREAKEELNIESDKVTLIGNLSEMYIPPSKSLVTPVLGFSDERPDFKPDKREVSELIEADLFDLLDKSRFGQTEIVRANYILKEVPAIQYNGFTIWGATAMMLNELRWLLRGYEG